MKRISQDAIIIVTDKSLGKANLRLINLPLVRIKDFYKSTLVGTKRSINDSTYILKIPTNENGRLVECSWLNQKGEYQLILPKDTIRAHIKPSGQINSYKITFLGKNAENYNATFHMDSRLNWNEVMAQHQIPFESYLSMVTRTYRSHLTLIDKEVKGHLRDFFKAEETAKVFIAIEMAKKRPPQVIDTLRKICLTDNFIKCNNPLYLRLPYYTSGMLSLARMMCGTLTLDNLTRTIDRNFTGLLKEYLYAMSFYLCCKGKISGQGALRKWYRTNISKFSCPEYRLFVKQVYMQHFTKR